MDVANELKRIAARITRHRKSMTVTWSETESGMHIGGEAYFVESVKGAWQDPPALSLGRGGEVSIEALARYLAPHVSRLFRPSITSVSSVGEFDGYIGAMRSVLRGLGFAAQERGPEDLTPDELATYRFIGFRPNKFTLVLWKCGREIRLSSDEARGLLYAIALLMLIPRSQDPL